MVRPFVKVTTFAIVALFALHCSSSSTSSDDTGSGNGPSLSTFCGSFCSGLHACDTTKDSQTCKSQCQNDNAAAYPKLRGDITSSVLDCVGSTDCATMMQGEALGSCFDAAAASVAPSKAGSNFCDAWAASATKCDRRLDAGKCLTLVKQYTDEAIGSATECTKKNCSDVLACIEAEFDLGAGGGPSGAYH